jgi:putative peptide zinc metalloprotease protein
MGVMLSLEALQGITDGQVLDSTDGRLSYLVVTEHGGHVRLSPSAHHLLRSLRAGCSYEDLARDLSARGPREVSPADVEAAFLSVIGRIQEIDRRAAARSLPPGFWLRLRLLPAGMVARLAAGLSWAYHPFTAILLLGFIAASFPILYRQGLPLRLDGSTAGLGYLLFLSSLLVHELGHASACSRFGATPSDIGFAAYLIYPAFYSDVTSAWSLRRWQRVVVDLGGTYFHAVVAGIYAGLYLWTGWEPLRSAFFMIWVGALFSLNPIFKFDGYWVLADALGVTNLSRQPTLLLRHALTRLRGRPATALPWPGWVLAALAIYAPATFLAWAWFVAHLVPFLLEKTLSYPRTVHALWESLNAPGPGWRGAPEFLGTTMFLGFAWFGAWSLGRYQIIMPTWQWFRAFREERRRRMAAFVLHES